MSSTQQYNKVVYLIAFIAALGGLLFGLDQGFIALALANVKEIYGLTTHQEEIYTSILATGGIFGTLCSGISNKYLGRRNSLVFAGFVFTVMSSVSALIPSFELLKLARFFLGFAVGIASFSVPLYLAETAPKDIRGRLGALFQLMITIGILVVAVANYSISTLIVNASLSLSSMFIFLLVFSVLMFILCMRIPKSPKWLLANGKKEEATEILFKIWNDKEAVDKEIELFEETLANTEKVSIYKLLTNKNFLKILFVGAFCQIFAQFSGINFIIYYAPTTFGYVGITGITAVFILYFINVLFTLPAIRLMDKWGRKKLLYIGAIFMAIAMLCASMSFYALSDMVLSNFFTSFFKILLFFSFVLFIMAFAVSWGPTPWILCSEIFPFKGREVGITITTMLSWTVMSVVSFASLSLMNMFGNFASLLLFAISCLLSLIYLRLFVPETKGVSLEKIEQNLLSGVKLRDLGK